MSFVSGNETFAPGYKIFVHGYIGCSLQNAVLDVPNFVLALQNLDLDVPNIVF
jgi:hypothetical protein